MTEPKRLPTEFIGDQIFVKPMFDDHSSLTLFADTGGTVLIKPTILSKAANVIEVFDEQHGELQKAYFPEFFSEGWIPGIGNEASVWFIVYDDRNGILDDVDGMLGQQWFADRVWTFDYQKKELLLGFAMDSLMKANSTRLGFMTDDQGERVASFPSIQASVDGEIIDFLFDTGATVHLSDDAYNAIGDSGPKARGTCFITASVFDRWVQNHPDWLMFEHADEFLNESIIEVPEVEIAGFKVGPVWFTRRPDTNFHDYMSSYMDKRVDGAIGGSLLRYFSVVMDYPDLVAYFYR